MMMDNIYALAAAEIAREAGGFLKHFSDNHKLNVEAKGSDFDFVTNADKESQRLVATRLKERFPDHRFVGEEDGLSDAEVADILSSGEYCWVCDPLDGTVNFIRGLGGYAVSVAVFESGEATCGAIYLPETDELYLAQKGGGATRNGVPIHVAEHADLTAAIGATHVPVSDMALRRRALKWNAHAIMASQNLRILGSSARTQAKVASGGIDYYYEYGPHPWDVAAGYVIVTEAGGVVTRLDGGPFDYALGGVLCASKAIHGEALRLLNATDEGLSVLP